MSKKKRLKFGPSKTVQHDTLSVSQIFDSFNANPQIAKEGYLDDDIKKIGRFHRRFVNLEDLSELHKHNKSLNDRIIARRKELIAEAKLEEEKSKESAKKSDS